MFTTTRRSLGRKSQIVMDSVETAAVRQRLKDDEQQTVEQLSLLDERAREAQTPDDVAFSSNATLADEASVAVEREKDMALRRSLQNRLLDVRSALRKLDLGTYGRCDSCRQEIGPQRLRARPHASLCIRCQAKTESTR
jgi:DnaK suppressor protein